MSVIHPQQHETPEDVVATAPRGRVAAQAGEGPEVDLWGWIRRGKSWRANSLLGGGLTSLFDQAVVSGTNFLAVLLVGRIAGAEELGLYTLGLSVLFLAMGVQVSLITTPYTVFGNRLASRLRTSYAACSLRQYAALAALSAALMAALGSVFWLAGVRTHGIAQILLVLGIAIPAGLLRDFLRRIAFAHLRFGLALKLDILIAALQIAGLLLLAGSGRLTAVSALMAMSVACATGGTVGLIVARREFSSHHHIGRACLARNWRLGKWVLGSQVVSIATAYAMPWMLAIWHGKEATGMFAACLSMLMITNPFLAGVGNLLSPKAAHAYAQGGVGQLRSLTRGAQLIVAALIGVVSIAYFLLGEWLLVTLYGEAYAGMGFTLSMLAIGLFFYAAALATEKALVAIERSSANFSTSLIGMFLTLTLGPLLVWIYGVPGAAMIDAIAAASVALVRQWLYVQNTQQLMVGGAPA